MNRSLYTALTACLLVLWLGACTPPRPTWVRPGAVEKTRHAPPRASKSKEKPPIDLGGAGGHDAGERIHVVQAGENLYRIGLRYAVDPEEIADRNEITDPTRLAVGRELVIPRKKGSKTAGTQARAKPAASRSRNTSVGSAPPAGRQGRLRWPVEGVLYSKFGPRGASRHDGIDISAPEGTPIVAAADGEVLYAGTQRGYGNLVILRHEGDLITLYAHNRENLVKEGDRVTAGQVVGKVGRTGRASGPHCHFEVRHGTRPHDPLPYLSR